MPKQSTNYLGLDTAEQIYLPKSLPEVLVTSFWLDFSTTHQESDDWARRGISYLPASFC